MVYISWLGLYQWVGVRGYISGWGLGFISVGGG